MAARRDGQRNAEPVAAWQLGAIESRLAGKVVGSLTENDAEATGGNLARDHRRPLMQGRAARIARLAHNQKVIGSNPISATNRMPSRQRR